MRWKRYTLYCNPIDVMSLISFNLDMTRLVKANDITIGQIGQYSQTQKMRLESWATWYLQYNEGAGIWFWKDAVRWKQG